jgi:hypothetical protein
VENKEEKTVQQAPSSKSTSPIKQLWKVKIKSVSNSTQEQVQPEALFEPSEVPWEVWANKRSCSEDINHRTPRREVNLIVINNFFFSTA